MKEQQKPKPKLEVVCDGEISDEGIAALVRLCLDLAEKEIEQQDGERKEKPGG